MKNNNMLIGCINNLTSKIIKTRWFYMDINTKQIKDVTEELYKTINKFNIRAEEIRKTGKYSLRIPYGYKNGLTEYSFGCGLSHYLQEDVLKELSKDSDNISFPLSKCKISMYTPNDIKNILKCKNAFDVDIKESLIENK